MTRALVVLSSLLVVAAGARADDATAGPRVRVVAGRAHLELPDGQVVPVAHGPWAVVLARGDGRRVSPTYDVTARAGQAVARVTAVRGIGLRRLVTRVGMADGRAMRRVSFVMGAGSVVVETRGFAPLVRQFAEDLVAFVRMTSGEYFGERQGELVGVEVRAPKPTVVRTAARGDAPVLEEVGPGVPLVVTEVRGEWVEVATTNGERGHARLDDLVPADAPAGGLAGAVPAAR